MKPESYLQYLCIIAKQRYNIDVNLKGNSTYFYPTENQITIHHKQLPARKCCSLLHELGHVIQQEHEFNQVYSPAALRVYIVQQEISAWDEGWKLYLSLPYKLNQIESMYWSEAAQCCSSYIRAVAKYKKSELLLASQSYRELPRVDNLGVENLGVNLSLETLGVLA